MVLCGGACSICGNRLCMCQIRQHCGKCGCQICRHCKHHGLVLLPDKTQPQIVCTRCGVEVSETRSLTANSVIELRSSEGPPIDPTIESVCITCGKRLGSGEVVVLEDDGVSVHLACFVCCVDQEPIDGPCCVMEGKLYCEDHYVKQFCQPCGGCGQRIRDGEAVNALNHTWHSECFVCAKCSTPLAKAGQSDDVVPKGDFKYYLHNGSVYCEKDYVEHFCQKCSGCGFHIKSHGLTALGVNWHRECFICMECRKPILETDSRSYVKVDGHPYCEADAKEILELSSDDRLLLQTVPLPDSTRSSRGSIDNSTATVSVPALERGACLSYGIREALGASASGGQDDGSSVFSAVPSSQGSAELPLSAFKEKQQWKFSQSIGGGTVSFDFEVYAPEVFKRLRAQAYRVSEKEYLRSLNLRPLSGGSKGEGKSGQLFFFSWDQRYIVKTVPHYEASFFTKCLKGYYEHFNGEQASRDQDGRPLSLLTKYCGFYTLKFEGEPALQFVIMANVCPQSVELKETYDIKGVLGKKRFVTDEQRASGVKVLKDRNFVNRDLAVGAAMKERLNAQLSHDVKFLRDHDRIDYSLLLVVVSRGALKDMPQSTPSLQWPSVEAYGLESTRPEDDEVFFMGIIDFCMEYTFMKGLEGMSKCLKHVVVHINKKSNHADKDNAVSASSASHYAKRFLDFVNKQMV